jgi:hypothetical protein
MSGFSGYAAGMMLEQDYVHRLEVWAQFSVPVARVGHLIALKLPSGTTTGYRTSIEELPSRARELAAERARAAEYFRTT